MARTIATYQGHLHTKVYHPISGITISTHVQVDPNKNNIELSPTDLLSSAIISSIITTISVGAERIGIDVSNLKVEITKGATKQVPHRLRFKIMIFFPTLQTQERKAELERMTMHCPVLSILAQDIVEHVDFKWPLA